MWILDLTISSPMVSHYSRGFAVLGSPFAVTCVDPSTWFWNGFWPANSLRYDSLTEVLFR
jgi:hypothetical protein